MTVTSCSHAPPLAQQLGALEQVDIVARPSSGPAGAVRLLRALDHRIEPRLVGRLQPAVGQLLDAMREAADQEAAAIRRRLDPEVLAPERLQLGVAELRQAGDLLQDRGGGGHRRSLSAWASVSHTLPSAAKSSPNSLKWFGSLAFSAWRRARSRRNPSASRRATSSRRSAGVRGRSGWCSFAAWIAAGTSDRQFELVLIPTTQAAARLSR